MLKCVFLCRGKESSTPAAYHLSQPVCLILLPRLQSLQHARSPTFGWAALHRGVCQLATLIENLCSRSILIKQQRLEIFNFPLQGSKKHPLVSSLRQCQSLQSWDVLCQHTPTIKKILMQGNKQSYLAFSSYFSSGTSPMWHFELAYNTVNAILSMLTLSEPQSALVSVMLWAQILFCCRHSF